MCVCVSHIPRMVFIVLECLPRSVLFCLWSVLVRHVPLPRDPLSLPHDGAPYVLNDRQSVSECVSHSPDKITEMMRRRQAACTVLIIIIVVERIKEIVQHGPRERWLYFIHIVQIRIVIRIQQEREFPCRVFRIEFRKGEPLLCCSLMEKRQQNEEWWIHPPGDSHGTCVRMKNAK